jgi:hypothetical protein
LEKRSQEKSRVLGRRKREFEKKGDKEKGKEEEKAGEEEK